MTGLPPDLLTTTTAAARAGVSERTMRKWIAAGKVSTHQTLDGPRVDRASLDAYRRVRGQKAAHSEAEPGPVLVTVPRPDLGTDLLAALAQQSAQLAALTAQVAALTALLEGRSDRGPEPPPEPVTATSAEDETEPGPVQSSAARRFRWLTPPASNRATPVTGAPCPLTH